MADSSVRFDLNTKAALYARAGIAEYWVFDLQERRMIVHREPQLGSYMFVVVYSESESVTPIAAPGAEFRVGDAFRE